MSTSNFVSSVYPLAWIVEKAELPYKEYLTSKSFFEKTSLSNRAIAMNFKNCYKNNIICW